MSFVNIDYPPQTLGIMSGNGGSRYEVLTSFFPYRQYPIRGDALMLNQELISANGRVGVLEKRVQRMERQLEELLNVDAPANERPPHY